MWSTKGFENEDYAALVKQVAKHRAVYTIDDIDDESLYNHELECDVSPAELEMFNSLVELERDLIKEDIDNNRSENQKYNDYMSDCADNNWKERA